MKLVIQRVHSASVEVNHNVVSAIKKGLLVFLGVSNQDDGTQIDWLAKKLTDLRVFEDDTGKINLSVKDINGQILLVPQFTLYANCQRGRRPDFTEAGEPEKAEQYFKDFAQALEEFGKKPLLGVFGAHMDISLVNDGPVTIILEKN